MTPREFVERLRSSGVRLRPGLEASQLCRFEDGLGVGLPEGLRALYGAVDGWEQPTLPFRLMPAEEVLSLRADLERLWTFPALAADARYFWADDQSNYVGLYIGGPLTGRTLFLEHEEVDLAPRHRSFESFLDAWSKAHAAKSASMASDFPSRRPLTREEREADRHAVQTLCAALQAAPEGSSRQALAFAAMAMIPPDAPEELLPFLDDTDMWIQERAAELLGKHQYVPAIPKLQRVAEVGTHNGKLAAELALGRIGTPECIEFLLAHARARRDRAPYVVAALRHAGWETDPRRARVRRPGSWWWTKLR